ncbi:hypothetical protein PV327_005032, partial [Microctonus hyperodae]
IDNCSWAATHYYRLIIDLAAFTSHYSSMNERKCRKLLQIFWGVQRSAMHSPRMHLQCATSSGPEEDPRGRRHYASSSLTFSLRHVQQVLLVEELPYNLGDVEKFMIANSIVTPIHIQPE